MARSSCLAASCRSAASASSCSASRPALLQQIAELLLGRPPDRCRSSSRRVSNGTDCSPSSCCRIASSEHCDAERRLRFRGRWRRGRGAALRPGRIPTARWRNSCSSFAPASRSNSRRRCFRRLTASSCLARAMRMRRAWRRMRVATGRGRLLPARPPRQAGAAARSDQPRPSDTPASAASCAIACR